MKAVLVSTINKKSPIISQSNQLTEARYTLTVVEQRLVITLLSLISPEDEDFKDYEIKVSDFKKMLEINTNAVYDQIKDVLKKLASRVVYIPEGKDYLITNWFSSARYFSDQGLIKISFDKNLKPYLLQLKREFTKYRLFVITQFKSAYTIRIYMLLKQYEYIGYREIGVGELREILGIEKEKYPLFKDFRKWVINQAQKELEAKDKGTGNYISDIAFNLETIRTGREITHLRFNIKKQTYQEALPLDLPEEETKEEPVLPALEALRKYGIQDTIGNKYLKEQGEEAIYRCIELFEEQKKAGTLKKQGVGLLITLLERGAGKETKVEKEEKEKKQKKEAQVRKATEEELRKERENKLSSDFYKQERGKWIASLSKEEEAQMLKEAREGLGFSGTMVKNLESPLIMDFVKSKIKGYEKMKAKYIQSKIQ